MCKVLISLMEPVTGSGCDPTSSWEKEAPIQASQESSQKPKPAKSVPINNTREELHTVEATASEDQSRKKCTVCRQKEAAIYVKVII